MITGERLKELRIKANRTQTDFAADCGISKQLLYKYENSIITNIPTDRIELFARELGTTPAYLMGWTNDPYDWDNDPNNLISSPATPTIKISLQSHSAGFSFCLEPRFEPSPGFEPKI